MMKICVVICAVSADDPDLKISLFIVYTATTTKQQLPTCPTRPCGS